jgi:hypothetical protein
MNKYTSIVVAALALVSLAGCAGSGEKTAKQMGAVNTLCPMKPDCALKAGTPTVAYKGQTVAFCCPGCVAEWATLNDAERDDRLAKAK